MTTAKQFIWDAQEGFCLLATGDCVQTAVDDDGMPIYEFVAETDIEEVGNSVLQPLINQVVAMVTASTHYFLNSTKSTYHMWECEGAVSGSRRTLEEISAINPDAKPCGKCQPPALS